MHDDDSLQPVASYNTAGSGVDSAFDTVHLRQALLRFSGLALLDFFRQQFQGSVSFKPTKELNF